MRKTRFTWTLALLLALAFAGSPPAARATVTDATPRIQYTASGGTAFTFSWPVWVKTDLKVYADAVLQTVDTHYTVTFTAGGAGGTVTFLSAPTAGTVVTILRDMPNARTTDFSASGSFRPQTLNSQLDQLTAQVQDLEEKVDRAAKLPPSSTADGPALPEPSDGAFLVWSSGNLANQTPSGSVTSAEGLAVKSYFEGTGEGTAQRVKGVWQVASSGIADHSDPAETESFAWAAAQVTAANGGKMVVPDGAFAFAGNVPEITAEYVEIECAASGKSVLTAGAASGNFITVSAREFRMRGCYLDGDAVRQAGSSGNGLHFDNGTANTMSRIILEDLTVTHQPGVGLYAKNPELLNWNRIDLTFNGSYGAHVDGSTGNPFVNTITGLRAADNGAPGLYLQSVNYTTCIGCEGYRNDGLYQFQVSGGRSNVFINPDVEDQAGDGQLFTAGDSTGLYMSGSRHRVIGGHFASLETGIKLVSATDVTIERPVFTNTSLIAAGGAAMTAGIDIDANSVHTVIALEDSGSYTATVTTMVNEADADDNGTLLIQGGRIHGTGFSALKKFYAYAASITPDPDASEYADVGQLTGNLAIAAVASPREGQRLTLHFQQDSTAGRTVTWHSSYLTDLSSGAGTTAGARASVSFRYNSRLVRWVQEGKFEWGRAIQVTGGAKLGSTGAGWVLDDASDRAGLAKLPASQTAETLVVPLNLPVGSTISGYTVRGQVESAGGAVTLDAALRKLTVAASDLTDAAVTSGAITQVAVTADTAVAAAVTGLTVAVTPGSTYYLLLTGTTVGSTDIDLASIDVYVSP